MYNYQEMISDPLQHICISEPLRRGTAEILADTSSGILVYDRPSGLYMLSATDLQAALELASRLTSCDFLLLCDAAHAAVAERLGLCGRMPCYQVMHMRGELPERDERLVIDVPDDAGFARILATYTLDSPEVLMRLRAAGELFFARDADCADVGFVGLHEEGCCGLLEVFEEQRGKGYGRALQAHIMRYVCARGDIPYGQVSQGNEASMHLQRSLGMEIGTKLMLYAWRE